LHPFVRWTAPIRRRGGKISVLRSAFAAPCGLVMNLIAEMQRTKGASCAAIAINSN
jgi:hypothetical protein